METALTVTANSDLALMPVMDIAMALNRREQITQFVKRIMKNGVDYGVIPGTGDRPALLKAGAEKLTTLFGLTKKFTIIERIEDWTGIDHDGEPFFYYVYRCSLYRGDLLIAEADGSCNSHETKYRYRKGERVCPKCGQANIRKSRQAGGGWYCWAKLGGCGATFQDGDKAIEGQEVGRILNPDVADQANTILKMAQKRALVAATLLGTSASEYFSTKEVPGMDEDDQAGDDESKPATSPVAPKPASGNGVPTKPADLLETVNRRVTVPYDNLLHLNKTLKGELGEDWNWPKANDANGWQQALDTAVNHARAKEQPEAEQDELPF